MRNHRLKSAVMQTPAGFVAGRNATRAMFTGPVIAAKTTRTYSRAIFLWEVHIWVPSQCVLTSAAIKWWSDVWRSAGWRTCYWSGHGQATHWPTARVKETNYNQIITVFCRVCFRQDLIGCFIMWRSDLRLRSGKMRIASFCSDDVTDVKSAAGGHS